MKEYKELSAKTIKGIVGYAHAIMINANDTFEYACADHVMIDVDDLHWVVPIEEKYPHKGLFAVMAYIRQQHIIPDRQDDEYWQAYRELEKLNPEVHSREYDD